MLDARRMLSFYYGNDNNIETDEETSDIDLGGKSDLGGERYLIGRY